jgi:hypothetical protein
MAHPVIACRAVIQDVNGRRIGTEPISVIEPGQRVGDYLFRRRRIFPGDAMLIPSMLLFDSVLAQSVEFDASLTVYEDTDWLLRAVARADTCLIQLREPLLVYTAHPGGAARKPDWRSRMEWVLARGEVLTPAEQADCLLCFAATTALVHGDLRGVFTVVRRASQMRAASANAWIWISIGVFAFALRDRMRSYLRGTNRAMSRRSK